MSADDQREQHPFKRAFPGATLCAVCGEIPQHHVGPDPETYGGHTLDELTALVEANDTRPDWDRTPARKRAADRALPDLIAAARERDQLSAKVVRLLALHRPVPGDEHAELRCAGCIAGYKPSTGALVNCAWPCPTIRAIEGQP